VLSHLKLIGPDQTTVSAVQCPDCCSDVEVFELVHGVEHALVVHADTCPNFNSRKAQTLGEIFPTN
jgi:hypothetical protein